MRVQARIASVGLLAIVSMSALFASPAMATTTIHEPPWADLVNGPMWGGFDPRTAAATAFNWLTSTGYHAFNDNNNVDAPTAVGHPYAADDAVFAV
jgi:hypothetical protein